MRNYPLPRPPRFVVLSAGWYRLPSGAWRLHLEMEKSSYTLDEAGNVKYW